LPAGASELYLHANEPTFLLLIIGGEGILVHDDNRDVTRTACPSQSLGASFEIATMRLASLAGEGTGCVGARFSVDYISHARVM
jgi:hypothetical protein